MITKLTKRQEQKMYEYRDEGIRIGQDITPVDHDKLETTIIDLYRECGLNTNIVFKYGRSPEECIKLVISDKKSNIRSNIMSNIWSNIMSNIESNIESNMSNIMSNIWSNIMSTMLNIMLNIMSNIMSNIESNTWWGQYNINWVQYYAYYNDVSHNVSYHSKDNQLKIPQKMTHY